MKCSFCPVIDRNWHAFEGFICCSECYVLLVIQLEFKPIELDGVDNKFYRKSDWTN